MLKKPAVLGTSPFVLLVSIIAFLTLFAVRPVWAAAGIWESYIVLNGAYYDVKANTALPDFHGQHLGTFVPGAIPLTLSGGEVKTFKNNSSDILSARLFYRVYPVDAPSGSFTAVNLPWAQNLANPGDQRWATSSAGINLLNGLADGAYVLQVYYEATTNQVNAPQFIYDSNNGSNYQATFTVASSVTLSDARAIWLESNVIGWNGAAGSSYKLLYDPDGEIVPAVAGATPCISNFSTPCYVSLTAAGTISGYVKNPNATGLAHLTTGLSAADTKALVKGQTAVASYNSSGSIVQISGVQLQSVLDQLYATAAVNETLGVSYSGGAPTVKVWAPTAQAVTLRRYADSSTPSYTSHPMSFNETSGVWSVTGAGAWDRHYYLFDVQVYVLGLGAVVSNLVTDPYAVTLSTDSLRSQFVNLDDANLKPAGWNSLVKPHLENFTDIVVYEMHVRDFSINDSSVTPAHRGTYMAFTYDGQEGRPLSNGMNHLLKLQAAGLTHVHLLPVFDIASVPEANVPRDAWPNPTGYGRNSDQQQAIVGDDRAADGFNWGYDPFHFGAPEGSYTTDPDGVQRILEFRQMVQALNQNGLRVVMDVVYNHTAASGQWDKSVLDKVVPGYYHRYTTSGALYTSSCCDDTASEYAMFEKLMIDTLSRFAVDYKVDGFRFDLMNLHTRQNMLNVKGALNAVDAKIYLYGEGWDFGSAVEKGLTTCPHCYAHKYNMTGAGIGLFNDIIRDAAHGGYNQDSVQIRRQGFINGLSYDWNGYFYANRFQSDLHAGMNTLRSGLRASGADWSGHGAPFAAAPLESMPYISKHDNETLFDQNVFKLPAGVSMAERVRAQNMGLSLMGLAQGVPFFHMGSDILRSKSLDRNSYDSGDWFNRVYWDYSHNNFGVGLPPAWDNESRWGIMGPDLANTALDPSPANIEFAAAHFREILRIRQSSPLFRLTTMAAVNSQVTFYNGSNTQDALIVMGIADSGPVDLDPGYETIVVLFNAHKVAQSITISGATGFSLHPVHTDGVDDDPVITGGAIFNAGTSTFTVPARTTAVFVSPHLITPPSTLDWVGLMWPRGGIAHAVNQGAFAPAGFDVYAQVYEADVTPGSGQGPGIDCFLYWGQYGAPWTDLQMSYNSSIGNNDEYRATIPQGALNALPPGTYGFTVYCKKTNESGLFWKVDSYDNANPANSDQGDGLITIIPAVTPYQAPAGGVFVHLFEWPWADVARECTFLAQKGFTAVQLSPPNEHLVPTADQGGNPAADYPWWARYQPVSHDSAKLVSRSGSLTDFQDMVNACNTAGVDVYVDAVVNHMAYNMVGNPAQGTAGTAYDNGFPSPSTRFYGEQYGANHFHTDCSINSYQDRYQVQRCKLSGLPDLNSGLTYVQGQIRAYLQALLDMGVKGFRIDAAKHMAAHELGAILNGLTLPGGGVPFIYHEVIDYDTSERVRDWEYFPYGAVSEFEYAITAIGSKFNCGGNIRDLATVPAYDNMMPGHFAVVFTDNHDNQRGHGPGGACIVDHRDGRVHLLANIFTLAYPYGYPMLTSSYYWTIDPNSNAGDSLGPPSSNNGGVTWGPGLGPVTRPVYGAGQVAGDFPANCSANYPNDVLNSANLSQWVCEHRHDALANMVAFRQMTAGEPVTHWWDNGSNQIAFGLGNKGYVAINRQNSSLTGTFQTGMPAGIYCDVTKGEWVDGATCSGPTITVASSGQIVNQSVAALDALAIHAGARLLDNYCVSSGSGNWSNSALWGSCSIAPGTGYTATIKSGHQVTLDVTVHNLEALIVEPGAVLIIDAGLTVNDSITNHGTLKQTQEVPAGATRNFLYFTDGGSNFKYRGVTIVNNEMMTMGNVTVGIRGNQDCTTNPASQPVRRCFDIQPAQPRNTTIMFWYLNSEANDNSHLQVKVFRWGSNQWALVGDPTDYGYTSTGDNYAVEVSGVTQYSPFLLDDSESPTAVTHQSLRVVTAVSSPLLYTVFLILALTFTLIGLGWRQQPFVG
jgi:pullulanase/glycogen debranching enzyme